MVLKVARRFSSFPIARTQRIQTVAENLKPASRPVVGIRTIFRISAAVALGALVLAAGSQARAQANEPASPYGGTVAEDIIARVNDQIITQSDYNRALDEMNQEGRQRGVSMQEMAAMRKDLLRNLIDQQLWLSKGKELSITGETELVKRLDDIRKQYNLDTIEDLEKAAQEQGVSFEDFKANIRNEVVTQQVMRQEVGEHIQMTPGEVERYYEAHQQNYSQPESVRLSEILISTGSGDDPAKVAAAKAKAEDIEARLHAGGDFAQLARSFSEGPTAAEGGDLGQYKRGQLGKLLEDKTFDLQSGQYTDPILTRQGYIILKVVQHTPGGPRPFKAVEQEVEQAYYMGKMEPAIRAYLNKMRDEAFIQIKQGYTDSGATYAELHPSIAFSAYAPPSPKKKAREERTRFRQSAHSFRQKPATADSAADESAAPTAKPVSKKKHKKEKQAEEKPGKREKIRFGQAPRETLPTAARSTSTEDAGALPPETASTPAEAASNTEQLANPLEPTAPTTRTRFSARAREKKPKTKHAVLDYPNSPAAPDAAEVADRQLQSAPLGLNGTTTDNKKKKKASETTAEKTRMSHHKKNPEDQPPPPQPTPIPQVQGAPAPDRNTQQPEQPPQQQ
jgi:peptidyl-prolyl cis-trans isomerase SurA